MKEYVNLPIKNSVSFLLKNQTLSDSSLPVQCTTGAPNESSDVAFCTGTRWCYTRTKNFHLIYVGFIFTPSTPLFISAFRTKVKIFFISTCFKNMNDVLTWTKDPTQAYWQLAFKNTEIKVISNVLPDYKKLILVIREEKTKKLESTNNQLSLVRSGNPPSSMTMSHRSQDTANLRLSHIHYTQTHSCVYMYVIIYVFIQ